MGSEGLILHVDADAFFASVEQRQKPSTARVPVIVGGLGPRGVVATASYQARRFGVGSAMATATATRRCPHGVFLAPRMQAYREHSAAIMSVLSRFAGALEQVSIDEAYLEIRSLTIPADRLLTEVAAACGTPLACVYRWERATQSSWRSSPRRPRNHKACASSAANSDRRSSTRCPASGPSPHTAEADSMVDASPSSAAESSASPPDIAALPR